MGRANSKSKSLRTRTAATPASVTVKVAPALKAAYDKNMKVLASAQSQGAKAFDALWEAVDAIVNHEPPLYVVGDFATANQFFESVLKETPRTAQRNIRVARFATPAQEEKYGIATLDAALAYLQAKNGAPLTGHHPIDFDALTIPVDSKGETKKKKLSDVTVRDLAAATAKLTGGARAKPKSEAYHAIAKELTAQKPLAGVGIHESAGVFSFERVPSGALEHFANAVLRGARGAAPAAAKSTTPTKKRGAAR
jgi:hypothetical protein